MCILLYGESVIQSLYGKCFTQLDKCLFFMCDDYVYLYFFFSDSGNSIFLTQADTLAPPLRKVRRHQAPSQSCTSSLSESESDEASTSFEPHNETDSRQQPSDCKNKKPEIPCAPKRAIHFPFLEKYYGGTRLTLHQQQTLVVNTSIGSIFIVTYCVHYIRFVSQNCSPLTLKYSVRYSKLVVKWWLS